MKLSNVSLSSSKTREEMVMIEMSSRTFEWTGDAIKIIEETVNVNGEVAEVEDKVIEDEDEKRGEFASTSRTQRLHVKKIAIGTSLQPTDLFVIVLGSKVTVLHLDNTDTHLAK